MDLCLSTATSSSWSPWPDLPPEVAGLILSRLFCQIDRISFGAVCRDWRFAVQHQRALMPPAMPWINLGRGFYHNLAADGNGNGKAWRRFAKPKGCHAGASFGGWLMYEHKRSHRCFLRDPFSKATRTIDVPFINLRNWGRAIADTDPLTTWHNPFYDILVCSSHLLVAIYLHSEGLSSITCLGPGIAMKKHTLPAGGHQHHAGDLLYKSIAFHHGKFFAVSSTENLFMHDFSESGEQIRVEHVIKERPVGSTNYDNHYLVTSADKKKLLMVRWKHPPKRDWLEIDHRTLDLQVFEANLEKGEWSSEVKDLGNQALFVGRTGSRALVADGSADMQFQGSRVFLLGYELAWSRCQAANYQWIPHWSDHEQYHNGTPSYCVYDVKNGKSCLFYFNRRPSRVKYPKSAWLFPSQ